MISSLSQNEPRQGSNDFYKILIKLEVQSNEWFHNFPYKPSINAKLFNIKIRQTPLAQRWILFPIFHFPVSVCIEMYQQCHGLIVKSKNNFLFFPWSSSWISINILIDYLCNNFYEMIFIFALKHHIRSSVDH